MFAHPKSDPQPKTLRHDLIHLSLLLLIIALVLLLVESETVRHELFDLQVIRAHLQGESIPGGIFASAALFLVCCALLIGIGMPRLWVSAVSGAIFGPVTGTGLALLATVAGAAMTYELGRTLLASYVQKRFGRRVKDWSGRFRENAFWWVLYIRLFPFANSSVTGLLCGSCEVPRRPYLAASTLGFIPLTLVFVLFGDAGLTGSIRQAALGFGLLLLTMAIRFAMKQRRMMGSVPEA